MSEIILGLKNGKCSECGAGVYYAENDLWYCTRCDNYGPAYYPTKVKK